MQLQSLVFQEKVTTKNNLSHRVSLHAGNQIFQHLWESLMKKRESFIIIELAFF